MTDKDETTLDPTDWAAFRIRAHRVLDTALDHLERAREGAVWQPTPDDLAAELQQPLQGEGVGEGLDEQLAELMPYSVGNTHPRFLGWVHGSGTPSNMLAEIVAAAMNANCGGRDHVGLRVEEQVIEWSKTLFSFPKSASGLVVSGTSMATIIALKVARDRALERAIERGVQGVPLVAFASSEAHSCVARAADLLGLGTDSVYKAETNRDFSVRLDTLKADISAQKAAGKVPFAIIGTAGTVNTGATDDLDALADLAEAENLWFHVDGAFGACMALSDKLKPRLKGIERADSLAFDFHKWMHVNYDAGAVLIRDGAAHRAAFSMRPDYLAASARGLAAGETWPTDLGPELSRGFRALKVWAQLLEFGPKRLGKQIEQNVEQAAYLADLIDSHPRFERLAPAPSQIVCFRPIWDAQSPEVYDKNVVDLVADLQLSGVAAPSTTRIHDRTAIRVNITNHRTKRRDLDLLVETLDRMAFKDLS